MTQRKIQKDQINLEVGNQPGQLIELEGPATGSPAIGVVGLLPELDGSQLRGLSPAGALFNVVEDLTPQLGGNLDLNGLDLTQGTTTIDVTNATLSVQTAASLVAAELQAASATGTANTYLDSGHASSAHGVYLRTFAGSNRGTLLWDPSTSELELQSYPSGSDILLTPGSSGNVILDSFTWPKIDGAPGQVLTTDGAGSLTFGEAGVEFPLRAPTGYVGSPVANEPPYNFDDERNTGWHRPDVQTVTLDVAGDESVRVVKTGGSPGPALGSPDIYANTGIVLHVLNDNVGNSVVRVQQDSGDSSELILDTTGGEWSITNEATNDNLEFKWNGAVIFRAESDGTVSVPGGSPSYETLVTDDNDIPNKKYVDEQVGTPKTGTLYTTVVWVSGSGSPEGVVGAPVGSMYSRTDGGTGTSLYVKESAGSGSPLDTTTGWAAK